VNDVLVLPQLSVLSALLKDINLFKQLQDPNFTGTVFAPINSVSAWRWHAAGTQNTCWS
jgi:hypothetical protein